MDDFMLPNDGTYFQPTEPEEQVTERRKTQSKSKAGEAILNDLIAKVTEDIERMTSVDAIHITPEATDGEFKMAHYGVQEQLAYARGIKSHMESLLPTKR